MQQDDKAIFDLVPEAQSVDAMIEICEILHKSQCDIERQLGDMNRTDATGNRMTLEAYNNWRKNARKALDCRMALRRKYKILIAKRRLEDGIPKEST